MVLDCLLGENLSLTVQGYEVSIMFRRSMLLQKRLTLGLLRPVLCNLLCAAEYMRLSGFLCVLRRALKLASL